MIRSDEKNRVAFAVVLKLDRRGYEREGRGWVEDNDRNWSIS